MLDKVNQDIKTAMKEKNKSKLEAMRMLKSAFLENQTSKKPKELQDVAIAHVKKLKDAMAAFPQGSSEVEKISAEIEHLKDYVPSPLTKQEVEDLVKGFLEDNKEAPFGMVMKFLSPQIKGKFDGRLASQLVKELMEG